jgi:hypothetical protein
MTTIRQAEKTLLEDMLEELRQQKRTSTEMVSHLRGLAVNAVLAIEIAEFDAAGIITRSWNVPFGCVAVANHGTGEVTVASGGPQDTPPTQGTGLALVPKDISRVINLAGMTLTLYGTPGERVSLQVFTRTWPPF